MEKKFLDELNKYLPTIQKKLIKGGSSALTKGEITLPQMLLLQIVFEKNMCTMTDLSKNMGITKSAVTGLTDRLIRSKLIARTRGIKDRRIVIISLTEKGKHLIKKVINEHQQMIKEAFSPLTRKEREIYLDLIKKIYKGLVKK